MGESLHIVIGLEEIFITVYVWKIIHVGNWGRCCMLNWFGCDTTYKITLYLLYLEQ